MFGLALIAPQANVVSLNVVTPQEGESYRAAPPAATKAPGVVAMNERLNAIINGTATDNMVVEVCPGTMTYRDGGVIDDPIVFRNREDMLDPAKPVVFTLGRLTGEGNEMTLQLIPEPNEVFVEQCAARAEPVYVEAHWINARADQNGSLLAFDDQNGITTRDDGFPIYPGRYQGPDA
jgi:hypothetical protein